MVLVSLIGCFIMLFFVGNKVVKEFNFAENNLPKDSVSFYKPIQVGSIQTRIELAKSTIEVIKDNPLIGVGAGNWKVSFPEYGLDQFAREVQLGKVNYQRAHNDWLQLFAENGFLGFICYLLFSLIVLYKGIVKWNQKGYQGTLILISAFLSFCVLMLFDFPRERVEHNLIFLVIAALLIKSDENIKIQKKYTNKIFLISLLLSLFIVFIGYKTITGEIKMKQIQQLHTNGNWVLMHKTAVDLNSSGYDINPFSMPPIWYAGVASFSMNNYDLALNEFKEAEKVHPYNVNILNNIASTYYQLGDRDKAVAYYEKVLEISPNYDEALINLAIIYYYQGEIDLGLKILSKCSTKSQHLNYKKVGLIMTKEKLLSIYNDRSINDQKKLKIILAKDDLIIKFFKQYSFSGMKFDRYVDSYFR